jgi:hypothetical protein
MVPVSVVSIALTNTSETRWSPTKTSGFRPRFRPLTKRVEPSVDTVALTMTSCSVASVDVALLEYAC